MWIAVSGADKKQSAMLCRVEAIPLHLRPMDEGRSIVTILGAAALWAAAREFDFARVQSAGHRAIECRAVLPLPKGSPRSSYYERRGLAPGARGHGSDRDRDCL